jgi:hypothetical protein
MSLPTVSTLMGLSLCLNVILDFSLLPPDLLAKSVLQTAAPAVMLTLASLVFLAYMPMQLINAHFATRLLAAVLPASFVAILFGASPALKAKVL